MSFDDYGDREREPDLDDFEDEDDDEVAWMCEECGEFDCDGGCVEAFDEFEDIDDESGEFPDPGLPEDDDEEEV